METALHIGVVSLFPEQLRSGLDFGVVGRALRRGLVRLNCFDPRDFAEDRQRRVDDRPYGGGCGMLLMAEPLAAALAAARAEVGAAAPVICLSPQGRCLRHSDLLRLGREKRFIMICGRYKGIDERLLLAEVDEEWSVGDFVTSGGELPAMCVIDATVRLVPDVLGHEESAAEDSFADGRLDCPHYTRPSVWRDLAVPAELLSGDHESIRRWRLKQSLGRTWQRRPELLNERQLSSEEQGLLGEYIAEARAD